MKTIILKSWKTTAAGLVVAGVAIAKNQGWIDASQAGTIISIATALGLVVSKDGDVTHTKS